MELLLLIKRASSPGPLLGRANRQSPTASLTRAFVVMSTPLTPESRRLVFNKIAYQVINYLEGLDHATEVKFESEQGLSRHEIVMWEKLNFPYRLPHDLRELYELFNGFCLSWSVEFQGRKVPIGAIRLNTVKDFVRLPLESSDTQQIEQESKKSGMASGVVKSVAAFLIDSNPRIGKVAILYRSAKAAPSSTSSSGTTSTDSSAGFNQSHQVWLQDLSCQWRPIASSFTDYFRLMVVHLGITGWQNAYTPGGVDRLTEQWMRLYCPERLAVDEVGLHISSLSLLEAADEDAERQQETPEAESGAQGTAAASSSSRHDTTGAERRVESDPSQPGAKGDVQARTASTQGGSKSGATEGGAGAAAGRTVAGTTTAVSPTRPRTGSSSIGTGAGGRTAGSSTSSSRSIGTTPGRNRPASHGASRAS